MFLWEYLVFAFLGLFLIGSGFIFLRSEWVFKHRVKLICEIYGETDEDPLRWFDAGCPDIKDYYPSYKTMVWKFWVWDADKFLLKEPFTRS